MKRSDINQNKRSDDNKFSFTLQTDRSANLGSTEATNNLVTPQITDQSVPIQVEPAPARRRRRVTWRESLEDVRTLV